MSEIFNIVLIKPNQPPLIYTFNDAKSKSLKKKQIPQLIYGDDTIQRIKEKIHIYTDINLPLSEMYLFKQNEIKLNGEDIYKNLSQNNSLEIDNNRLNTFFNNCDKKLNLNSKEKKVIYSQIDINNIVRKYYSNKQIINTSIGHNVVYNSTLPYIANPFDLIEMDSVLDNDEANIVTKNKKLLLEFNEIKNNTLYLCCAEDVLNFFKDKDNISEEYLLKVYYPQLYIFYNINSLDKLLSKRNELKTKLQKNIEKIKIIENKIRYLNLLGENQKTKKKLIKKKNGYNGYYIYYLS